MSLPLAHLSRRFFQVVLAKPLSPVEQAVVASALRPAEARLFWSQAPADQRHAFETMDRLGAFYDDPDTVRAALLHDVGKGQARLGAIGRVVATLLDAAGVRLRGRLAAYRTHGPVGAELLRTAGCSAIVVDFAARHPDPDPGAHDPAAWQALLIADDV